jgi:hypothetical protein
MEAPITTPAVEVKPAPVVEKLNPIKAWFDAGSDAAKRAAVVAKFPELRNTFVEAAQLPKS